MTDIPEHLCTLHRQCESAGIKSLLHFCEKTSQSLPHSSLYYIISTSLFDDTKGHCGGFIKILVIVAEMLRNRNHQLLYIVVILRKRVTYVYHKLDLGGGALYFVTLYYDAIFLVLKVSCFCCISQRRFHKMAHQSFSC